MADDGKVTAFDIYAALDARYRKSGNGYWNQVTVRAPDGELRLDGVALDWSTGRMWVLGFEVNYSSLMGGACPCPAVATGRKPG